MPSKEVAVSTCEYIAALREGLSELKNSAKRGSRKLGADVKSKNLINPENS